MRLPIRGRRESEGRVVGIEDSTLARAGEAATRLALEETLLRRGWRVLFVDDQYGPIFGPQRPKLFDGIAVRLRPGSADKVELRLVHMESDTLEAPSELIERVKRAARSATVEWLVAAFDGESMRVVPELDEIESAAVRPSPPQPTALEPLPPRRTSPPPPPAAAVTPQRRPNPQPSPAAGTRNMTATAASGRRRPPRSRPGAAPTTVGSTPGGRLPSRASTAAEPASAGNRRGGTPSGTRLGGESGAAEAQGASASDAAGAKRGRRRGKRGGRRRSGRPAGS